VRDARRVALALAAVGAILHGGGPAPAAGQVRPGSAAPMIRPAGTVVELQTNAPVATAMVLLFDSASAAQVAAAETDGTGAFVLSPVPRGPYVLRVERIGFKTVVDSLWLDTPEDAALAVFMVPDAVDLEPVVVTTSRTTAYYMRDFERRRATGSGTFITRSQIERKRWNETSQVLQSIAGVRVVRGTRGEASRFRRGTGRPQVYVDGAALHGSVSIDTAVLPDDIEGIEVYSDAGIPLQYAVRSPCGAILVWTRPAVRGEGRKTPLWKVIIAGSVLVTVMLLGR
jgi:hypothetical protein